MANVIQLSALEDPDARKALKITLVMLVLKEDWAALLEAAEAADMQRTMLPPESERLDDWVSVRQAVEDELRAGFAPQA